MFFSKIINYKARLISMFVGTVLLGIVVSLLAIYNASREQQLLDHVNSVHAVFQAQIEKRFLSGQVNDIRQLANELSTQEFIVLSYIDTGVKSLDINGCSIEVSSSALENSRLSPKGGVYGVAPCLVSWHEVVIEKTDSYFLVLHHLKDLNTDSIYSAYSNRLLIPLAFFIWITVWGSLMLGNLINRLKKQKDEVEHVALHDALTGLPNRTYFLEKMSELVSYSSRNEVSFMLAMVDLNKFKEVNDNLGHNYGDELLRQVSERLRDSLRDYDMVARLGGDEFVIVMQGDDFDANLSILKRIYQSIVEPYEIKENKVQIGASIGASYFPVHDVEYSELVHKADVAMYEAKKSGGGVKVYAA